MPVAKTAAIYARVSTQRHGEEDRCAGQKPPPCNNRAGFG